MASNIGDLFEVGKPILVTAVSNTGAEMIVKEAMWAKGVEMRVLDAELLDAAGIDAAWQSFHPGDHIMVTCVKRSDKETQEAVLKMMHDADKVVVVAENGPGDIIKPEHFAHWAKF